MDLHLLSGEGVHHRVPQAAADTDIDLDTYEKLRARSVREVRETGGSISFQDDLVFQKSL